jgi:hypothetical protein
MSKRWERRREERTEKKMRSSVMILISLSLSPPATTATCAFPGVVRFFVLLELSSFTHVRCIDQPASDLVLACKQEVQWIDSFFFW